MFTIQSLEIINYLKRHSMDGLKSIKNLSWKENKEKNNKYKNMKWDRM